MNLTDPGTVANDGRIQIAEFTTANLGSIFSPTIDAHFDIDGIKITAGAGLNGPPLGSIEISLAGSNPSDPGHVDSLAKLQNLFSGIQVQGSAPFLDFDNIGPQQVLELLDDVITWLDQFRGTSTFPRRCR